MNERDSLADPPVNFRQESGRYAVLEGSPAMPKPPASLIFSSFSPATMHSPQAARYPAGRCQTQLHASLASAWTPPKWMLVSEVNKMKKVLPVLVAAALGIGLISSAQAHVFVGIGVGVPFRPAYPVYAAPLAYYPPPAPSIVYAPPPPPVVYAPPPPVVVGYYPHRYYYPVY
jgi:hypothetical protein